VSQPPGEASPAGSTRRLALFPLDNVVLLPGLALPLHVFEPRYRQLAADVIRGDRRIGMIAVRPEHAHEMNGDPPLYTVGCAGFVSEHRRLPDGRYAMLLQGVERFRVLRELPRAGDRLYRSAEVEPLPEQQGDGERLETLRERVLVLLSKLVQRTAEPGQALETERLRSLEVGRFANVISQAVSLPTPEKQSLLEADSVDERLERLANTLDFRLAAAGQSPVEGSGRLH